MKDLNCPVCAAKLEKAARGLPGARTARVEFGSGALHLEYDAAVLSVETVRDLVKRTGLEVAAVIAGKASARH